MPILGKLRESSRDSFESDSDWKESWDDRRNSPKTGIFDFSRSFEDRFNRFDIPFDSIDTALRVVVDRPADGFNVNIDIHLVDVDIQNKLTPNIN